MSRSLGILVLLAATFFSPQLRAQVSASASQPFSAYIYGMASASEHELNYGHALGESGGIIVQRSRWLALDARGVILRERVPLHTYSAEIGPHVSRRYGPIRPYAEGLVGLGHSGYIVTEGTKRILRSGYGLGWSANFGADLRITPRFQWRVADYSYGHIYAGTGARPAILSTGVVYRFF